MSAVGGLAAAQAVGAQQSVAALGGGGGGGGGAPAGQAPPRPDRFQKQIGEMQRNAAFGVFIPDLLKAKSGGREDMQRNIKLLIRKQYFNTAQVTRLVVSFTVVGMMIATALYCALWSPLDLKNHYESFAFGVCAGGAGMMIYWWFVGANWEAVCNKSNPKVDPDKRGIDCLDNSDCTSGYPDDSPMCVQRRPSVYWRFIRNSIIFGLIIGAGSFAGMAGQQHSWDGKHTFAGTVFGASCGWFLWQIFPLAKKYD